MNKPNEPKAPKMPKIEYLKNIKMPSLNNPEKFTRLKNLIKKSYNAC